MIIIVTNFRKCQENGGKINKNLEISYGNLRIFEKIMDNIRSNFKFNSRKI